MRLTRILRRSWCLVLCLAATAGAVQYELPADPPIAAAILLEAETGTVLFEYNADTPRSPASTQKLLLQLVILDAVDDGRLSLKDSVYTSAWASRMGGSQVFLKQGEVFPLEELMAAISISSANDACVAVAEHMAGTVEGFVSMMNAKAETLGLQHTRCVNVHGLDDTPRSEGNQTTARDLSRIARALLAHPHVLDWSGDRIRPFRSGKFTLYTTNGLLGRFPGLDGLKTGYTARAGFNLVATAKRGDMRLISVVLGGRSEADRNRETKQLLGWGFGNFVKGPLAVAGESVGTVPLDWGMAPEVGAVIGDSVLAVLTPEQRRRVKRDVELPELREAPVAAGDTIGVLHLSLDEQPLAEIGLLAAASVDRMSLWEKLMSYF